MNYPENSRDLLGHHKIEEIFKTVRTGIRTAGGCFWGFVVWKIIQSLAGQDTWVDVSILADAKFSITLALAGSAAAWAVFERRLRHRKVETMQGRIRELEQKIDPDRTTSGLTPMGKTNSRDLDK